MILKKKKSETEKPILINFKMSKAERKTAQANAKRFAGGNMSRWMRFAAVNCRPRKEDLESTGR